VESVEECCRVVGRRVQPSDSDRPSSLRVTSIKLPRTDMAGNGGGIKGQVRSGQVRSPTNGQEIRATGRDGKALLAKSEEKDVITTVTKVCDSLYMTGKARQKRERRRQHVMASRAQAGEGVEGCADDGLIC
jgi:hypothetical protein